MSDFSELCPLFNTGVFNEVVFPKLEMSISSSTCNALEGLITAGQEGSDNFTFGRTVVVTEAYLRRFTANLCTVWIWIDHRASAAAVQTVFGTWTISVTASLREVKYTWNKATHTDKTFTSDEVLGISSSTATTSSGGEFDLIVQYKEK